MTKAIYMGSLNNNSLDHISLLSFVEQENKKMAYTFVDHSYL